MVSGDIRPVAQTKLSVFGLDRHIVWKLGAHGEDNDVRADLVRLALQLAAAAAEAAVLIGHTPADIEGANANSVRAIAVASGRSNESTLRGFGAGAETVLPDLRDTELLVHLVHGGGQ